MKNDMKLIMENWRKSMDPLDPLYAQNVLGIKIPLVEGKYFISESLRKDILQEQLLLENFFKKIANFVGDKIQSFKEDVFEEFGNLADLFKNLWAIVNNEKEINLFKGAIETASIKPIKKKLKSFITKLKDLDMNDFATKMEDIQKKILDAVSLQGWKGAVSLVGVTLLWNYAESTIGDMIGKKIDDANPINKFIENVKPEIFNKIQDYFTNTFPNLAAKLYGEAAFAASSGALGWMAIAYRIFKAVSWVAKSLASTIKRFEYVKRQMQNLKSFREKT